MTKSDAPTTPTTGSRFRFAVLELCVGCRRWVIDPQGRAIEPWLPRDAHAYPQLIGGNE